MTKRFPVSAKAVVPVDDQVLLVRKETGFWDLPGGRLKEGEPPEAAVARETFEEIGVPIRVGALIDCAVRPRKRKVAVFLVTYLCTLEGSVDNIVLSHEHTEAALFDPADVDTLQMEDLYKKAVRDGLKILHGGA